MAHIGLSPRKAKKMLREKKHRSPRQRRLLGLIAGGGHPTRLRKKK